MSVGAAANRAASHATRIHNKRISHFADPLGRGIRAQDVVVGEASKPVKISRLTRARVGRKKKLNPSIRSFLAAVLLHPLRLTFVRHFAGKRQRRSLALRRPANLIKSIASFYASAKCCCNAVDAIGRVLLNPINFYVCATTTGLAIKLALHARICGAQRHCWKTTGNRQQLTKDNRSIEKFTIKLVTPTGIFYLLQRAIKK